MVSQNPSSSENEQKNYGNEQEAQKPKVNKQKQNSDKKKEDLNNLALQFQRSTPGSHEADLNYSRFVKEAKLGKIGGVRPSNQSLSNNEYHQVLQDSKQDTLIRSVSFIREKFDILSIVF